jgi:MFS family permease
MASAIASNIGSLMEAVGESWLMTSLVASSFIVALTWASDSLSITALALPTGALADIVDRRKLLIISQRWMFVIALTLAIVTIAGFISPLILLILIFLLGLVEAISTPTFSPFLLGTVPRNEIRDLNDSDSLERAVNCKSLTVAYTCPFPFLTHSSAIIKTRGGIQVFVLQL